MQIKICRAEEGAWAWPWIPATHGKFPFIPTFND
jgi:hypothetical protein